MLTSSAEVGRMLPESEPLSDLQIAKLRAWIDQGLVWDDELLPTPKVESDHWAFQIIASPDVPGQSANNPYTHPIDALIASRHAEKKFAGNKNRLASNSDSQAFARSSGITSHFGGIRRSH
ncbi:hypothetical protein OAE80_03120 [Planctomycetaceae bacterium]|nr:hypothetical protein [Planctomycetaceae bacterium]